MVFLGEDTPVGGATEYNAGNKKFDRELTVPVINGTQAFYVSSSSSALTYIYPVNGAVRTLTLDLPCKNEWVTVELNGEMLIPGGYTPFRQS